MSSTPRLASVPPRVFKHVTPIDYYIMTKATETFVALFAASGLYFALYTGVIPTGQVVHDEILPYLPWWCLVTFGAYALGTLGWGVFTFKNKEASYRELLGQIGEAKAFYKSKGIDLDE